MVLFDRDIDSNVEYLEIQLLIDFRSSICIFEVFHSRSVCIQA